ncbi:MAG TPA: ROK family transcriptional regulator [Thermomicrobiales bacterium]|nr:ROK family transcriptional regulator [Thermomicrobiales bacterium]
MIDQRMPAFAGHNQRSVRQSNRAMIFRALHALGPIARVDLARQSGLTPGTVTHIVDELLRSGLVEEIEAPQVATGGRRRVGRRPVQLRVCADARFAIGIDLARTTVTGAIVNLAGKVLRRVEEPTRALIRDEAIDQVVRIARSLLDELSEEERRKVVGAGVGAPGALSVRTGRFRPPPSYGSWEEIDLRQEIERAVEIPTMIDNNANTAALGELWFGAGAGLQNFVLLNLGTGVGAGLVLDGDLYRGEHDLAAEIGHVSIAMDGPRCACGNSGCLEMYVSMPRVLAAARAALESGEPSVIRDAMALVGGQLTLPMLLEAAEAEDALALRVLNDVARFLAAGIVNIINTLDPQVVLIGRELAAAGETLLVPVREEVRRRVLPVLRPTVRIEVARLTDAPVVGAGVLALREFFEAPV